MPAPQRSKHPWLLPMMTAGLMAGILLGRSVAVWYGAAAALAASLLCTLLRHGRARAVGAVLTALSLGALLSWAAYNPALPAEGEHRITGVVIDAVSPDAMAHMVTTLRDVTIDGEPWPGGAYWSCYLNQDETVPEGLVPGARISITAQVYEPSGQENPDGFDFREYLLQQNIRIGVYGKDDFTLIDGGFSLQGMMARIRWELTLQLIEVMGPEAGGYAAAMLLGLKDFMPDTELATFQALGVTHILSISGYHVGVLCAMLSLALRPLRLKRSHALLVRSGLLLLYCLLTGGRAPVVRAALLSILFEVARVRHRQALPLHTLCAAAAVQLLFNPTLLTGASFQLTYSAMVGLLLLRPQLARLVRTGIPAVNWLWKLFTACLAAQLGVLPALLYWFGEFPLLGLIANMFIPFFFTLLMALYWATLLLLWLPGVRNVLSAVSMMATKLLMNGIRPLGELDGFFLWTRQPGPIVLLGFALLTLGLIALPPRRFRRRQRTAAMAGTLLTLSILLPLPHWETTYIQFSVGEGDAALLHDQNTVVAIDTGEDGGALSAYLHSRRLPVDALILTHLHYDHALGLEALMADGIPIRRCYLPADATVSSIDPGLTDCLTELSATGTEICTLSRGDVLPLPSGQITVLWPEEGRTRPMQDANHASLALLAEVRGTSLLLTGDLTGTYEHYAAVKADVLKAAHHGSESSTTPAFLQAVDPQAILLSCGNEKREISLAARTGDIPTYSTHTSGAIIIRFDEDSFRIYPFLAED